MIELLLLLVGGRVVRKRWRTLAALGVVWIALGIFFLVDAMIDDFRIPPVYFTVPLLIDAVVSAVAALGGSGTYRALRFAKAGVLVAVSALVLIHPWGSDIVIGLLVGTLLVVDACWRAASAYVVRFAKWRRSLAAAGVEFLIGVWSLLPWPTYWQGEVGIDVGTLMIVTGVSLVGLALRLRRLPPDMPIARILSDGWPSEAHDHEVPHAADGPAMGDITIHVWTPTGGLAPLRRGVARYVAALDENGVISTGHAAMEAPGVYISHYPAVEIDRDQSQFAQTLRATADNNVPGKFQPSYEFESGEWCPSARQIVLAGLDLAALREFWCVYSLDATYNLTSRNCSSSVAKGLDAAIEGVFAGYATSPWFVIRLLLLPELWTAGLMRRRAAAMAWTPGFVLDYARSLSTILAFPAKAGFTPRAARQEA